MGFCCMCPVEGMGGSVRPRRDRMNSENSTNREERPKGVGVHTSKRGAAPAGGGRMTCAGQRRGGLASSLETLRGVDGGSCE